MNPIVREARKNVEHIAECIICKIRVLEMRKAKLINVYRPVRRTLTTLLLYQMCHINQVSFLMVVCCRFTGDVPTSCPNNCHGHGNCHLGKCHCFPGHIGLDCADSKSFFVNLTRRFRGSFVLKTVTECHYKTV